MTPEISKGTSKQLKKLMMMCWKFNPDERPDFTELSTFINTLDGDDENMTLPANKSNKDATKYAFLLSSNKHSDGLKKKQEKEDEESSLDLTDIEIENDLKMKKVEASLRVSKVTKKSGKQRYGRFLSSSSSSSSTVSLSSSTSESDDSHSGVPSSSV